MQNNVKFGDDDRKIQLKEMLTVLAYEPPLEFDTFGFSHHHRQMSCYLNLVKVCICLEFIMNYVTFCKLFKSQTMQARHGCLILFLVNILCLFLSWQYAHKLAYLVGQNIRREPSELLADRLFFL